MKIVAGLDAVHSNHAPIAAAALDEVVGIDSGLAVVHGNHAPIAAVALDEVVAIDSGLDAAVHGILVRGAASDFDVIAFGNLCTRKNQNFRKQKPILD